MLVPGGHVQTDVQSMSRMDLGIRGASVRYRLFSKNHTLHP